MIRRISAVTIALVAFASGAGAQQSRAELLRTATAAYDDFAPERALVMARAAVDPSLGPTDSVWARGVHLLAQILIEAGNQEQARTWARWAMRTHPAMPIDTVNFLAGVVTALREARTFTRAQTSGDAVTRTAWRWAARTSTETNGRLTLGTSPMPVPVSVRVLGGGLISTSGLSLPPGTYEIEAGAPGYLPARLSREVLPGVTTVLTFSLTSASVASDIIADAAKARAFQSVVPLTVRRFSSAPACAAGTYVGGDLVLTTYAAIRGADTVVIAGSAAPVRVLAHNAASDQVILQAPTPRTDSMAPSAVIADGMTAWAVRLADCRTPTETRVRVTEWSDRPRGALQLSAAPAAAVTGTPLFDVDGRLIGVWSGGTAGIAGPVIAGLIDQARRNRAAGQTLTPAELARRENHAFGSFVVASDVTGATVRVSPTETWHWSSLQASGPTPLTFIGPMGRYRVEVSGAPGQRAERDVTIRAGAHERVMIPLRVAASATPSTVTARKRSKLPWILGGVAVAGAGAALALGGGGGGGGPPGPPPPTTGTITVSVPVNPPFRAHP